MKRNYTLINSFFYSPNLKKAFSDSSIQIAKLIQEEFSTDTSFLFLIGKGLNGVDGYYIARRLKNIGFNNIELATVYSKSSIILNYFVSNISDVKFRYKLNKSIQFDVIVDCLVGTGFKTSKVYAPLSNIQKSLI